MEAPQAEVGADESERPSPERRLELLADERRMHVIGYLQELSAPVAVADLAKQIARWESDGASSAPPDHQDRVLRSLSHVHLPKLETHDVIVHDRDRNTVEPGSNFAWVMELVDSLSRLEIHSLRD